MRALAAAAALLLGLSGAARAEDAAGRALAQAKAELAELEQLQARAGGAPPPSLTPEQGRCRAAFSMDSAIADAAQRARAGLLAQDMRYQMLGFHSLCYYQCVAYAAGDVGRCGPLNVFRVDSDKGTGDNRMDKGDNACRDHFDDIVVTKALITGDPGFGRLCRRNLTQRQVDADTADRVCRAIEGHLDDPATLCRQVQEAHMKLRLVGDPQKCEPLFAGIAGNADACRALPEESHTYERCFEFAAFSHAWRARDISVCGDHPLCRVMMGGGPANCAQYAEHPLSMLCGGEDQRSILRARLAARGQDLLSELGAAERALPDGDARAAKLRALRARAKKLLGPGVGLVPTK